MPPVEIDPGVRRQTLADRTIIVLFEMMALAFWVLGQSNQPVSLLGLWLLAALMLGVSSSGREASPALNATGNHSPPDHWMGTWRWIFLGSLASLLTVMFIGMPNELIPSLRGLGLPGQVLGAVYLVTAVFLLHGSPFFFRRLGSLAVLAWFIATFAALTLVAPRF